MRRTGLVGALVLGTLALLATALTTAPTTALASGGAEEPVKLGDEAPEFTLKDQDGSEVALASFRGNTAVLIAFYPGDFTSGCTNEMKCLAREHRGLEDLGVTLLAISVDPQATHARFAKALGLRFRLLSDEDLAVAKTYGVHAASADGGYAARSVFLVDPEGKLRFVEREFLVPRTLDGSELKSVIETLSAENDPLAVLKDLPSPEREGKEVLLRWALALTREDVAAAGKLLHPQFGERPGEPSARQRERRKARLDACRSLFTEHDLRSFTPADLIRLDAARVLTLEAAATARLGAAAREVSVHQKEDDLLVVFRGGDAKVNGRRLMPREGALVARQQGDEWKIVELADK